MSGVLDWLLTVGAKTHVARMVDVTGVLLLLLAVGVMGRSVKISALEVLLPELIAKDNGRLMTSVELVGVLLVLLTIGANSSMALTLS